MHSDLMIVEATLEDISSILEINQQYLNSTNEDGFLVVPYYKSDIEHSIMSSESTIFLEKDSSDMIFGYAKVSSHFKKDVLKGMTWIREDSKQVVSTILENDFIYIGQVAVRLNARRQGVASRIYAHIESYNKPIIVFVAWVPHRNMASLYFHKSRGYQEVGKLTRPVFGRFQDYQSLCYVRR